MTDTTPPEIPPEALRFPAPREGDKVGLAIVGGGLSGTLLALRLSRDRHLVEAGIRLLEHQPSLGGRLFFPSSQPAADADPAADLVTRWNGNRAGRHLSGFGFECLSPAACRAIERHIHSLLEPEERELLDTMVTGTPLRRSCFVVKKEFVSWNELLAGPSDILTRKEANALRELLDASAIATDPALPLGQHAILQDKGNSQALMPLLESFLAREPNDIPFVRAGAVLGSFRTLVESELQPPFARAGSLEIACEAILRRRGVDVRLRTQVARLKNEAQQFRLEGPGSLTMADHLVFATPLLRALPLISRDALTGAQAKWVAKTPPLSAVAIEYATFQEARADGMPSSIGPGAQLVFPVERTRGMVTSDGRLLLFAWLPFEDSLQAPAVREAVARIRRAAKRMMKESALSGLAGKTMPPRNQSTVAERIVLLPVAQYLPLANAELSAVRTATRNLLTCGDHFTFGNEPWANVVESVHHTASQLRG